MDNIKEWISLDMPEQLTMAFCREDWLRISAESSLVSPDDPVGQGTELNNAQGYLGTMRRREQKDIQHFAFEDD